jgi:hypothetical protein
MLTFGVRPVRNWTPRRAQIGRLSSGAPGLPWIPGAALGNRICGYQACRFLVVVDTQNSISPRASRILANFPCGPHAALGGLPPPLALRLRSARAAGICFTRGWGPMTEDTTIKPLGQANPPEPIFCFGGRFFVQGHRHINHSKSRNCSIRMSFFCGCTFRTKKTRKRKQIRTETAL